MKKKSPNFIPTGVTQLIKKENQIRGVGGVAPT
jgi:hypothetical protein